MSEIKSTKQESILITSYKQFEEVVQSGHGEFYATYTLDCGKIVEEAALFDNEDPLSYVLIRVKLLLTDPNFKLYQVFN